MRGRRGGDRAEQQTKPYGAADQQSLHGIYVPLGGGKTSELAGFVEVDFSVPNEPQELRVDRPVVANYL